MLQHVKKAKAPKEAWDTFATIFSKKNNRATTSIEWVIVNITTKHDNWRVLQQGKLSMVWNF